MYTDTVTTSVDGESDRVLTDDALGAEICFLLARLCAAVTVCTLNQNSSSVLLSISGEFPFLSSAVSLIVSTILILHSLLLSILRQILKMSFKNHIKLLATTSTTLSYYGSPGSPLFGNHLPAVFSNPHWLKTERWQLWWSPTEAADVLVVVRF